jgi:2-methylcitrate dehydratase PrpD
MAKGFTREIAAFVAGTSFSDLSSKALARLKLHILDALGIALGAYGTGHRVIEGLFELAQEWERDVGPRATVLGSGFQVPCPEAAMVNAVLTNFLDFSDGHFMGGHINDRLVPVALAVAESTEASGKEFLTALSVGYEVYIELSYQLFAQVEAASVALPYFVMLGTLAGAAVAGKLLGLGEKEIAGALGSAASIQIGGAQYVLSGGHEKDLCPGHEAHRAVLAALLAQKDILGSGDILEGERGISQSLGVKPAAPSSGLGRGERIWECYIKPFPACRYLHASIEAAMKIVDEHGFSPSEIVKVTVRTNSSSAKRDSHVIRSHVNAIFSHSYQVATVLWEGRPDLPTAWEGKLHDPSFLELMRKVEVLATPEYDELFRKRSLTQPPWPADVEVILRDGTPYRSQVLLPKGDPGNPMSPEEVRRKFADLAKKALPEDRLTEVIEAVEGLEELPDVRNLVHLLVVAEG